MQTTKSEDGGTPLSPESNQDGVGTGKVHPNAYHSEACMSSRQDGTRYCGWLLHGHPWWDPRAPVRGPRPRGARNEREGSMHLHHKRVPEHRPAQGRRWAFPDQIESESALDSPDHVIMEIGWADYRYRINIWKDDAIPVLVEEIGKVLYTSFKDEAGRTRTITTPCLDLVHDVQLPDSCEGRRQRGNLQVVMMKIEPLDSELYKTQPPELVAEGRVQNRETRRDRNHCTWRVP